MNFGFLVDAIRDPRDYRLGGTQVPFIPYQPDGDWTNYLPAYEAQAALYETCGCSVWGTQNQIEILYARLYGTQPNYSERFTAERCHITCPGTDPNLVYEDIRREGMVDQAVYPMPQTLAEFQSSAGITQQMLDRAQMWADQHTFMHEWLWTSYPTDAIDTLRKYLTSSPIAVSVTAWHYDNGVYVDNGLPNCHWCVVFKVDEQNRPWVFDSYDNSIKILSADHKIQLAKRIWLNKKTVPALTQQKSLLEQIIQRLTMQKDLLDVCIAALGTDASPADLAPDELGCAETVTTILRQVYPLTPILTGTYSLYDYLSNPANGYVRLSGPEPEAIIICATEPGHPYPGHTGFVMGDMTIASNDSRTGKFIKNYDVGTWTTRYETNGGYKIHYFRKK